MKIMLPLFIGWKFKKMFWAYCVHRTCIWLMMQLREPSSAFLRATDKQSNQIYMQAGLYSAIMASESEILTYSADYTQAVLQIAALCEICLTSVTLSNDTWVRKQKRHEIIRWQTASVLQCSPHTAETPCCGCLECLKHKLHYIDLLWICRGTRCS